MVVSHITKALSRLVPPFLRSKKQAVEQKTAPIAEAKMPKIEAKHEVVVVEAEEHRIITGVQSDEPQIATAVAEQMQEVAGIGLENHVETAPFAEPETSVETEKQEYVLPEKFFEIPQGIIQSPYAAKFSQDVPMEHVFVLNDGRRLKNLNELVVMLQDMNDSIFSHHVNDSKNDFANWVRDVIKEKDMADSISSKITKKELLATLRNFQ